MKVQNYSVRILNGKKNPATETSEGYVPLQHAEQYSILLRNFSNKNSLALISIDGKEVACVMVPANEKVTVDGPFDSDKKFTFYKSDSEEAEDSNLHSVGSDDLGLIEVKFIEANNTKTKTVSIGGNTYYIPFYVYDWWYRPWWGPYITWAPPTYISSTTIPTDNITISGTYTDTNYTASNMIYISGNNQYMPAVSHTTSSSVNAYFSSGGTGLSGMAEFIPAETENLKPEFDKIFDEEVCTTIYLRLVHKSDDYKEKASAIVGFSNKKPAPLV